MSRSDDDHLSGADVKPEDGGASAAELPRKRKPRAWGQPLRTYAAIAGRTRWRDLAGRWAACASVCLVLLLLGGCHSRHTAEPAQVGQNPPASQGGPLVVSDWGPKVVLSDVYRAELVALRLANSAPRRALLSIELSRLDGKPVPSDITFDIDAVDNRLVRYEVPSTYEGYGAHGERVSMANGNQAYRVRETLTLGPLHGRVRWFLIKVIVYSQSLEPGRTREFRLTEMESLDFGKHPISSAAAAEAVQSVSLVGREVPVYEGARDLKVQNQADARVGSLSYIVRGLPYPSRDVADFYGEWALDHDWIPDRRLAPGWKDFLDATQVGEPWVYQLRLEWTGSRSNERLVLICQYSIRKDAEGHYRTDSARDQAVAVGIYPADSAAQGQRGRGR